MLTGDAPFQGQSEPEQLEMIAKTCGEYYVEFEESSETLEPKPEQQSSGTEKASPSPALRNMLAGSPDGAIQFCALCLQTDPGRRPTCDQLLQSDFLKGRKKNRRVSKASLSSTVSRVANSIARVLWLRWTCQ